MKNSRRLIIFLLFLFTLAVAGAAIYIGIQLQDQPDVTPSDVDASDAQCCENAGGACGSSCGGFDLNQACSSSNNWCWCARISNGCVPDGGGSPEGTSETMCGYGSYNGQVCYTCPEGWRGAGTVVCSGAGAQDCGNCNQPTPTPTPTNPPSTPTPTPTPSPTPTFFEANVCGDNCSTALGDSACPQDHQCIDDNNDGTGVCQLNNCVTNPAACYSDGCTPVPECGGTCQTGESNACPQDHVCVDPEDDGEGTCVFDLCIENPELCEVDQCTPITPECGEPCNPDDGGVACPNDHSCIDPEGDGVYECTLNECAEDPSQCTDNQCIPRLPDTALISDEADRIIIAVSLILFGMLMYRIGLPGMIGAFLLNDQGETPIDRVGKKLDDYNEKQKKQKIASERQAFEEKALEDLDE